LQINHGLREIIARINQFKIRAGFLDEGGRHIAGAEVDFT
jgi:hypothetical protein